MAFLMRTYILYHATHNIAERYSSRAISIISQFITGNSLLIISKMGKFQCANVKK